MPMTKKERRAYMKQWRRNNRKNIAKYFEEWKKNNLPKIVYLQTKHNAKHRKIPFKLTFEEFKNFAVQTEYIDRRGRTATSLTIDRIRPKRGYVKGNIRAITMHNNVKIQRKLEFHLRQGNGYENFFRYTMPSFGDLTVVHL